MSSKYRNLKDTLGFWGLFALSLAIVLSLSFGVWAITVGLSSTVGSGNVHKDVQDAKNREHWSASFNGKYNRILADQTQINVINDSLLTGGNTAQDKIDLQGARMNCMSDVAAYNADTQNVLAAPWLPSGLPTSVPLSVCGPAAP